MGDLVSRIYLTNIKLLPLALCGDVYEGDETDREPEKESVSTKFIVCNYSIHIHCSYS